MMIAGSLFAGGVLQIYDVLQNGYWQTRGAVFGHSGLMHALEWARLPGDLIFIAFGVVPLVIAALRTVSSLQKKPSHGPNTGASIGDEATSTGRIGLVAHIGDKQKKCAPNLPRAELGRRNEH